MRSSHWASGGEGLVQVHRARASYVPIGDGEGLGGALIATKVLGGDRPGGRPLGTGAFSSWPPTFLAHSKSPLQARPLLHKRAAAPSGLAPPIGCNFSAGAGYCFTASSRTLQFTSLGWSSGSAPAPPAKPHLISPLGSRSSCPFGERGPLHPLVHTYSSPPAAPAP